MWVTFKLYKLNLCVFPIFGFHWFCLFLLPCDHSVLFSYNKKIPFFLKEKNLSSMPKGDKQVKSVGMTTLQGIVFSNFNCHYGPLLNLVY